MLIRWRRHQREALEAIAAHDGVERKLGLCPATGSGAPDFARQSPSDKHREGCGDPTLMRCHLPALGAGPSVRAGRRSPPGRAGGSEEQDNCAESRLGSLGPARERGPQARRRVTPPCPHRKAT